MQTQPVASYIPKAAKKELGFGLLGWALRAANRSSPLRGVLATTDKDKGLGTSNWSSYSSAQYDATLAEALRTVDDRKREKLFQEAAQIAIGQDYAIIPLYNQVATWAARKDTATHRAPTKRRSPSSSFRNSPAGRVTMDAPCANC